MATDALLQATDFTTDPNPRDLKALPDGTLVTDDMLNAWIARGFGWTFSVGDLTTPILGGGAGTTILDTDPEWVIEVPTKQILIPLRFAVQLEAPLIAADDNESECVIGVDRTQVGGSVAVDGTVEIANNMRTDILAGCPCNPLSALTGAANTTPTRSFDLVRMTQVGDFNGTPDVAFWTTMELLYEPETPPLIVGPATVYCYWGGTVATSGYAQVFFLSVPASEFTNLS